MSDANVGEAPQVLLSGLGFGECPRWNDGRLWVSDWAAGRVLAVSGDGTSEVMAEVASFPLCFDPLPDGRVALVDSGTGRLLRRERDGTLTPMADLTAAGSTPWNEVLASRTGDVYVNGIGFEFGAEEPPPGSDPGFLVLVRPDGRVLRVAEDLAFPNGMALTTDGRTLLVAESYGRRITAFDVHEDGGLGGRRTWAELDGPPDGVCLDADGALWVADVPGMTCSRVREGGDVTDVVHLDRGCFSCALGGEDGRTLFLVAQRWDGGVGGTATTGQVLTTRVTVAAVSHPW
jgi:sugar lactone lactonase YvrE